MSNTKTNLPENKQEHRGISHGFSNKRNIIIIALAAVLALGGVTAVSIGAANHSSKSALSGIQLAERYLSEIKYEQAIIEFQRILEIEPMNVDAYLGLAEAYIGLGNTEKALEVLRQGLEMTGDPRLQAMIDELTKPDASLEGDMGKPEFGSMGSVMILGTEIDIATTETLDLGSKEITDDMLKQIVPQIKQLTNLTWLYLSDNQISDIAPLAWLTKLTSLSLDGNQISDITPLAGFTKLTNLNLNGNQISDIAPLAGLTNLKYLDLWLNQISDITPLVGLTNLTYLRLDLNQISDITPLAGLTDLTTLHLHSNQISDITPLAGLINMTDLRLYSNQISDITPLAGLTNLTHLALYNNQISDITPLSGLTNMIDLRLHSNQISNTMPLARLTKLKNLSLYTNQISDSDQAWLESQLPNCEIQF